MDAITNKNQAEVKSEDMGETEKFKGAENARIGNIEEVAKIIREENNFLIFAHIRADGDALGSSTALCIALRKMGAKAAILMEDDMPEDYSFLAKEYTINIGEDLDSFAALDETVAIFGTAIKEGDYAVITVDCVEPATRFPKRRGVFEKAKRRISIDHHKTATPISDAFVVDTNASATAELVYELINLLDVDFDEEIANAIYLGICTDTGSFAYSNVTSRTHMIASKLYEIRENYSDIYNKIYANDTLEKITLQSDILSRMQMFEGGKVVVATVSRSDLEKFGAKMEDAQGIVERLRNIKGVEVAIFLKEEEFGIKASLRSKDFVDVASICQKRCGGGHLRAAGFSQEATFDKIIRELVAEIAMQV